MKQYFVGGGNLFAQEAGRILLVYEWSNKRKRRFPQYWNKLTLLGSIYRKRMPSAIYNEQIWHPFYYCKLAVIN